MYTPVHFDIFPVLQRGVRLDLSHQCTFRWIDADISGCQHGNHSIQSLQIKHIHHSETPAIACVQPTEVLTSEARDKPTRVVLREMLKNMKDKSV